MVSGIERFLSECGSRRDTILARLQPYESLVPVKFPSVGVAFYENEVRTNLAKWGSDAPPLTPEDIDELYELYKGLPTREDNGTVLSRDLQPSKKTLKGFLKETSFNEAIIELVDNAIDNYVDCHVQGYEVSPLSITILIRSALPGFPNGVVVFRENSGGVAPEKRIPLIRLGQGRHEAPSIGAWGWGAKLAYHTLGSDIEIFTRHWEKDDPVCFWYPPNWLLEPDREPDDPRLWEGSWYNWAPNKCLPSQASLEAIKPGEAITVIHRPDEKLVSTRIAMVLAELEKSLSIAFAEKEAKLRVSLGTEGDPNAGVLSIRIRSEGERLVKFGSTIDEQVKSVCIFFPGLEPLKVSCAWSLPSGQELKGVICVGLTPDGKTDLPNASSPGSWRSQGIFMWGNGRPFLDHMLGRPENSNVFVYGRRFDPQELAPPRAEGTTYPFTFPKSYADRGNLVHIWIDFESARAEFIPWNSPRKVRFATVGNPFKEEIEKTVWDIAIGYAHASSKLKREFIAPFDSKWNCKIAHEKLKLLFPEGYIDRSGYDMRGKTYEDKIKSLEKSDAAKLANFKVRQRILTMDFGTFCKLRAYDQIPSRSYRYVSTIIARSETMRDPEFDKATLKDFWEPLLGGSL